MINFVKDDFDESIEDIMKSVNQILEKTGKGYETATENYYQENKQKIQAIQNKLKLANV